MPVSTRASDERVSLDARYVAPDLRALTNVPVLDGFRAVAILAVIGMHFFGMPLGWMGVDLFFVLSGFLITRILLNTRTSANYFGMFYARRALRIFPIYFLVLLVVALLDEGARGEIGWYAAYLANFRWVAGLPAVPSLEHMWSLATEEQFYLVWPILVCVLARKQLVGVCGIGLGITLLCRALLSSYGGAADLYSFSIFTRVDGILAGSLVAILIMEGWKHTEQNNRLALGLALGCVGIVGGLAVFGHMSFQRRSLAMSLLGMPAVTLGSAAALWYGMGLRPSSRLYRSLTSGPMRFVGRISYGLYLYHFPILKLGEPWLTATTSLRNPLLVKLVLFGAALSLATASWYLLEVPINGLKRFFRYRRDDGPAEARASDPSGPT
jgi:peptidoglycan/LPS O-acetylase OafA/YrhL